MILQELIQNSLFEILLFILWFGQFLTTRHYAKKDLTLETLAVLTYNTLSDKLDWLIEKGYATAEERHELNLLYNVYKKHGWNGDMDARINIVFHLPFDKPEVSNNES